MGGTKLCLLLLLGTYAVAQQDAGNVEDHSQACLLAKRFKNFRRFVYDYQVESFNGVNTPTDNKSGPKISCNVEVDVPQTCSFILRTTECSLSEISGVDTDGTLEYRAADGAEAFKSAMAKNLLKFTVEGLTDVKVFPEDDEPVNILNIKRGIVSTLMVPVMEEERNALMATVHGLCPTDFTVNSRKDIATDVTVSRNLSRCSSFFTHRQTTSPLALVTGMNRPLSMMIGSTQTCSYRFDNHKKHMTSGVCTEKHVFRPLSQKSEFGIATEVKQTMTLRETAKINDRVFDRNENNVRFLPMDVADDKSPVQTKDAALDILREMNSLQQFVDNERRPAIFHKLVSELRGLKADILRSTVAEMMAESAALTWQALVQCGTPECTSAMLTSLMTFDRSAMEVDAAVYALGLMANPSRLMAKDMLAMAQYKQSKPIMYALSNIVRKLYQAEGITPEITAVSDFITSLLGKDCAGEKELTFLALRVTGNMGEAMEAANPAIKTALLRCMRQPATTLSVQLAAIQAFRRMTVTDEVRTNLQRVSQYSKGAVQKRLAAYLMLMKNPQDSDVEMVKKLLQQEQNGQVKSFVTSHVFNIITSMDAETQELGGKLRVALQDIDSLVSNEDTADSRNYKMGVSHENMGVGVQGNVIFDPSSQLPREVLLETTLKAFGFSMDIWEIGMQGKGFEPTIDALFGTNGFFPDTLSKTLYWTMDKIPQLEGLMGSRRSEGRKIPENLGREIARNFNKLMKDLQSQESPEAMAYLRIMGEELGYMKGGEVKSALENLMMYAERFSGPFQRQIMAKLMSGTDNDIFAHYIFMDNNFVLPTASGLPLTFGLSGTFTPGAKGGFNISPKMKELVFMPSLGVEFVTQMGVHVPEFVASTVKIHTNMYHESTFNAKITVDQNQVKLSIPNPETLAKFRISNTVQIMSAGHAISSGHMLGEGSCSLLYPTVNFCRRRSHSNAGDDSFFPMSGTATYFVRIEPSAFISEYTATVSYNLLSEGKDGRQKVDSLKLALRIEGTAPTEATVTMKYNRNRNVFTTQIQIPDYEAAIKIAMTDSNAKGKTVTLELSDNNVPQLSLIGRAKLQAMYDGMLQLQLLVPSLGSDAAITATMSKDDGLAMELKSDVKFSESFSNQAVKIKYGGKEAEVQLESKTNFDTAILEPYGVVLYAWITHFTEYAMDQQVVNTDMKLRHIFNKAVEASNIWMDKIKNDVPYVERLREMVNDVEIPKNLFMNLESSVKYSFNKNRVTFSVPLPYGGKSSEELRIPRMIATPQIAVPQLGMELTSNEIRIPAFTIPSKYVVTLPLMGMLEASAKVSSNYYKWKATASAGNNTEDSPDYMAKFNMLADSPIQLLCFSTAGAMGMTDTDAETMTLTLDGSLNHMLMRTSFNSMKTFTIADEVKSTGKYNVYAFTPLGLETSLTVTTQVALDSAMLSGDVNTDGSLTVGPVTATTTYLHTFSVEPAKKEARLESTLRINSEVVKFGNKITASYAKEKLAIDSNTNMNMDPIKHTTKTTLNYNGGKLTMHSDSVTKADERMLRSTMDFTASGGQANLRVEHQADDTANRGSSVLIASMNPTSLDINTDASLNIFSSIASNKATLSLSVNGLATSCTTTAQHGVMTFEHVFHGGVDTSGATMSLVTKGAVEENKAELSVDGKLATTQVSLNGILKGDLFDINTINTATLRLNEDGFNVFSSIVGSLNEMRTENTNSLSLTLKSFSLHTKTDNVLNEKNSYMHDVTVKMEGFTASFAVKNNLKIMEVNFVNNANFKVEPYNMELTGTTIGRCSHEALRHVYEVKFVDAVLSAKCNTNGNLLGTELTHATDMDVDGLNIKFNSIATFKSPHLHLDSKVKTVAAPFTLDVNAIFKSDGVMYLYGQQSGDLYSKFLLKAEPLMITNSFDYRASTTHELEDSPTIKTSMDSKFNSVLSLKEQSMVLKMSSKVDEHSLVQDMSAYNTEESIGIEMRTAASTPFFSDDSKDYDVSGFVKYDKNSDSHFIQIPFVEDLPVLIESIVNTMTGLMDHAVETLSDIDTKYEISATFQKKVSKLKEVVDNVDFNGFARDLKHFARSVDKFVAKLAAKFPTEEVIGKLKSVVDTIMAWIQKYGFSQNWNEIYDKLEEILSSYEVENMIGAIMDEIVKLMRQFRVRERIQSIFAGLRSIDIQPLAKKVMATIQKFVNELLSFDLKPLIDGLSNYLMRIVQEIQSFDYDAFTMELKDKVADMSKIPCFGKLYGEFRVTSPHYKLRTSAGMENATTSSVMPEFKMNLISNAESTLKVLEFTMDASAHLVAPEMNPLSISENIKMNHSCFALNHKGTMILDSQLAQVSADTTATAKTEIYTADLVNKALFVIDSGLSVNVDATNIFNQNVNVPALNIFSEMAMSQKTVFLLKDGTAHLTINNLANGNYAVQDFSDEENHQSDFEVVMDLHTAKVTFESKTDSNSFKMKEKVLVDICIFRHVIVEAKVETDTAIMKNSVAELKLQAKAENLKIDFAAAHKADFVGLVEGALLNYVAASVELGEFVFDTKNKGNVKVAFPFNLYGKIDLQNDVLVTLNSEVQQASLTGLARFNQFKYSHLITMDNDDGEINFVTQINGEANLDVLKERISIPEIDVRVFGMRTQRVKDFSLWEDTGLSDVLITTQQTFDTSYKLKYRKNPEMITIDINLEPLINGINSNVKTMNKNLLIGKDKAVAMMSKSFDTAKAEYEKYSIEMPKTVTVPAYKVPMLNIDKSSFTIPLPDFSAIKMPSMYAPSALRKLSLPKIALPKIKTIMIPVMGDLTSELTVKTAMLTFKTESSILTRDGFVAKFDASTTSEHRTLNGKIEGKVDVSTADRYAMTSHLSVKHALVEGKHDGTVVVGYKNVSISVINSGKERLFYNRMEVVQEIKGNPEDGLLFTMHSPSAGFLALEMQTKQPALAKARLYGRFPSEPKTDVDIVALKLSVKNGESLNVQTTWNMEIPNEAMLKMKKVGPQVVELIIIYPLLVLDAIHRNKGIIQDSVEWAKERSKLMLISTFDNAAAVYSSDTVKTLTDSAIVTLKEYKKKVEIIFDAVVTFLRETRFQVPGYEHKLSGLQLYQKFSAFIADISEQVVQNIPINSVFSEALYYFSSLEFVIPGSDFVVSGREMIDAFFEAINEIRYQAIATVRKLGEIQLEEILEKLSQFLQFTLEKSAKFLRTLKSVNRESLNAFENDLHGYVFDSPFTQEVLRRAEEVLRIIEKYHHAVSRKLTDMLPRHKQLEKSIHSWIDFLVKRINAFLNDVTKTLQDITEHFQPYIKVGDRQVEVDVPLPFVAKRN
ncbi:apolipoprotein B-100-like [Brachionichthys hirsutus]|uniref:apolipoprotein B-100-like n=1 Tax=Brachionichthys hirsutus TaxID=412623 RepID=UPI0036046515